MATFIGDYVCKADDKGRVLLPAAFKKQLASSSTPDQFVVKKDIFEKCLVLYPGDEWERQCRLIKESVNPYNKQHNTFLREFFRGTAEVQLDAGGRLLLPKRLLELIEAGKELVLAGQDGKVEIWDKERYEGVQQTEQDFASLAENILGGLNQ
jgi:Uncharacterized protein conserved in bacteria